MSQQKNIFSLNRFNAAGLFIGLWVISSLLTASLTAFIVKNYYEAQRAESSVATIQRQRVKSSVTASKQKKPRPALTVHRKSTPQKSNNLDYLSDPQKRLSKEFRVPKGLKLRTQFWFNIYTKYTNKKHILHHSRYPWIIYKVIDTTKIINSAKGPLWLRRQKALDYVASEKKRLRKALKKLAHKKSYKKLTRTQRSLYRALASVRGKRSKVFKTASHNLRSQLGQKNFFLSGLKNSRKYLAYMEKTFKDQKLPIELTRIPFVESSFNEKAQSRVGASGVWQIMPQIGKKFVYVNKYIDERNNPLKATIIAAKILKQNHRSLKQWPLTVTAYNHGIGGLRKALRISKSKRLGQVISRYHRGSFRFASSNFYTSFLAALHAEKYHQEIFEDYRFENEKLVVREPLILPEKMRTHQLAKLAGVSLKTLLKLNLDLKKAIQKNTYIPKGFEVHLPLGHKSIIMNKLASDESPPKPQA